jgi:hypothetical protein
MYEWGRDVNVYWASPQLVLVARREEATVDGLLASLSVVVEVKEEKGGNPREIKLRGELGRIRQDAYGDVMDYMVVVTAKLRWSSATSRWMRSQWLTFSSQTWGSRVYKKLKKGEHKMLAEAAKAARKKVGDQLGESRKEVLEGVRERGGRVSMIGKEQLQKEKRSWKE